MAAIGDRRPKSSVGKIVALAERESASGQTILGLAGYLGASRLLFKPVSPDILVKTVNELVRISKSKPSRPGRWGSRLAWFYNPAISPAPFSSAEAS
jgi:hypothetical protein